MMKEVPSLVYNFFCTTTL